MVLMTMVCVWRGGGGGGAACVEVKAEEVGAGVGGFFSSVGGSGGFVWRYNWASGLPVMAPSLL